MAPGLADHATSVRRESLLIGKCLGAAAVASCQGAQLLIPAGLFGVPYHPIMLAMVVLQLAITALAMAGLGAVLAVSIRTTETFHAVTGFLSLPLLFLSGAMFPFTGLPSWLAAATTLHPVSYAVDAVRRTLTTALPGSPAFAGPTWAGWRPSALLETTVLAALGVFLLHVAARRFTRRSE
ncbi:ABC transporter permease [Nonomuraea sp. NPDC046570]|uniref:ABC transporter permease n=1 Tax=Nonomuraea sp. NPDC046570 TaxID=3155255 RepID=UPI003409C644